MKPVVCLIIFVCGLSFRNAHTQGCLQDGIVFTRQSAIDSFPVQYPGCHSIAGTVKIIGPDILYLDSLAQLTQIGDTLTITETTSLTSLHGLHNIITLDGAVIIEHNDSLQDLVALQHQTEIKDRLSIWNNPVLPDLEDLLNIQIVWGVLRIGSNNQLTTLSPLINLHTVAGNIVIANNDRLKNLHGLEGLTIIHHDLTIFHHDSLLTFEGLHNITKVIKELSLDINPMVTDFTGLRNLAVAELIHIYGMHTKDLNGFDNLVFLGGLTVGDMDSMISFEGMPFIERIGGRLSLYKVHKMTDLKGLEKIKHVSSLSFVNNQSLQSLHGLHHIESITSVLEFNNNPQLTDITALSGARGLIYAIWMNDNSSLVSLRGIDSICSEPFYDLIIRNSENLSMCHTPCICAHLLNEGNYDIISNMTGCNSRDEIIAQCMATTVNTLPGSSSFTVTPNPVINKLTLKGIPAECFYTIFSTTGQLVQSGFTCHHQVEVQDLLPGLYVIRLLRDNQPSIALFNKV